MITPKNHLRLFLVESPSSLDALEGRAEGPCIANIAKLIGHSVLYLSIQSNIELKRTCKYISSICSVDDRKPTTPLCLHISAHGDKDGLLIGGDNVGWESLVQTVQPFLCEEYKGDRIIVLSCCQADQQELTSTIITQIKEGKNIVPPKYLFCLADSPCWSEAAVGWTLFYYLLPKTNLDEKGDIQNLLSTIQEIIVDLKIVYFRWDETKSRYLRFEKK